MIMVFEWPLSAVALVLKNKEAHKMLKCIHYWPTEQLFMHCWLTEQSLELTERCRNPCRHTANHILVSRACYGEHTMIVTLLKGLCHDRKTPVPISLVVTTQHNSNFLSQLNKFLTNKTCGLSRSTLYTTYIPMRKQKDPVYNSGGYTVNTDSLPAIQIETLS